MITNLPSNFKTSLSYDGNHAYLDLALNFTPPRTPNFGGGLSVNQNAVGNALIHFFNANGSIQMVYGMLTPSGLTQASAELATGSQQSTFDAMTQFLGLMSAPFIDGRDGNAASGAASGYATTQSTGAARDAYAMFDKAPVSTFDRRWNIWAAGFGGSQTTDGNATVGSNTATSSIYGTAVGADYRIRRLRLPVLRWQAAALTSRSRVAASGTPICSRPAHLSGTRSGRPTFRPHWPMAAGHHHRSYRGGRRHRPVAGEVQRQCLLGAP